MDADEFREAMSRVPSGVTVISAAGAGGHRGLTAGSFISASLEPPLVLACLDSYTATLELVLAQGVFNASVLARAQEFLADRFSGRAPAVDPGWKQVAHRLGDNGVPIVEGCVAWFECRVEQSHPAGDHTIVVGRVTAAGHEAGEPLVFWDRAFWRVS